MTAWVTARSAHRGFAHCRRASGTAHRGIARGRKAPRTAHRGIARGRRNRGFSARESAETPGAALHFSDLGSVNAILPFRRAGFSTPAKFSASACFQSRSGMFLVTTEINPRQYANPHMGR